MGLVVVVVVAIAIVDGQFTSLVLFADACCLLEVHNLECVLEGSITLSFEMLFQMYVQQVELYSNETSTFALKTSLSSCNLL